jgi:hypothetical protein
MDVDNGSLGWGSWQPILGRSVSYRLRRAVAFTQSIPSLMLGGGYYWSGESLRETAS